MTLQQAKDFFTVNYGVRTPQKARNYYKKHTHSLLVWLIMLITIIPLILAIYNRIKLANEWKAFDEEFNRRASQYPGMFDALVKSYIPHEQLLKKALKKSGIDEDQIGAAAGTIDPIYFDGQDWKRSKNCYRQTRSFGFQAKVQTWNAVLFTADQVIVYTLAHDFYEGRDYETTEEYFYKDITNIKTDDEEKEISMGDTKHVVQTNSVVLASAGGKLELNIRALDDYVEHAVQAMKQLLRQKKS